MHQITDYFIKIQSKEKIEMAKKILKKNQIVIISVTVIVTIALLFTLLRCFHIVLHIGDSYKSSSALNTELRMI
jgi:hypothetical protein